MNKETQIGDIRMTKKNETIQNQGFKEKSTSKKTPEKKPLLRPPSPTSQGSK